MDWFQAAISDDDGLLMDIAGDACTGVPLVERRARPNHEQPLKCPRCESTHTKFCYYNNYNLTQPRYFCKACRRYWTKGGTLRNIPVGGACRKTKKLSSNPKKPDQSQTTTDLHLPFPEQLRFENMGNNVYNNNHQYPFGFLPSFEQGNMGNILESYQRLMLPYDQNNHHEVEGVVKPILSLHDCNSDAGTFEYNLGSWTSLKSGYAGSSATNPLV